VGAPGGSEFVAVVVAADASAVVRSSGGDETSGVNEVETRYVKSETGWIAYQVVGAAPVDVLVAKLVFYPVDLMWDEPALVQFLDALTSFSRHIWFDLRGTGASSAISQAESRLVESHCDDMIAVVDQLGCEQVVVLGLASAPALLFAATHPDRTKALVLVNPSARFTRAEGYPEGMPDAVIDETSTAVREAWGTGSSLRRMAPSMRDDPGFARWAARAERLNTTPDASPWRRWSIYQVDVRHVLGAIRVPTLVIYRTGWRGAPQARYVAEHIANAKTVELAGDDFLFFSGDTKPMLEAIEEFVTGSIAVRDDDRVLATVMFTDVVGSTELLVEQGDRRWQAMLDSHDRVVRDEIDRFRGREINTMGDGFLATFDGPGRAIRCACAIRDGLRTLGIDVRIGLHTGEIERRGDDISGIAVVIAQRIQAHARPGEVLASSTIKDLVSGSDIAFADQGTRALKGVPDPWRVFSTQT
jgi:class 3 adenylate cyclase